MLTLFKVRASNTATTQMPIYKKLSTTASVYYILTKLHRVYTVCSLI